MLQSQATQNTASVSIHSFSFTLRNSIKSTLPDIGTPQSKLIPLTCLANMRPGTSLLKAKGNRKASNDTALFYETFSSCFICEPTWTTNCITSPAGPYRPLRCPTDPADLVVASHPQASTYDELCYKSRLVFLLWSTTDAANRPTTSAASISRNKTTEPWPYRFSLN